MSVVILGGNEFMVRAYKDLCREYQCQAKVYPKMSNAMKNIGSPDLLVLFTNTMSHKMVRCAMNEAKGNKDIRIVYSHASSKAALRSILEEHAC